MMLSVGHLALKLRSQSLNEETKHQTSSSSNSSSKSDLDRDSGTESDDELGQTTFGEMDAMDGGESTAGGQRRRERTRSESGKENATSSRPTRQRRGERTTWLRERTETVMAARLAVVATLSDDRQSTESPIDELVPTDSALPSDSDHGPWASDQHSSEEELECINGAELSSSSSPLDMAAPSTVSAGTALRFGPSAFGPPRFGPTDPSRRTPNQQAPEKRKWGQVNAAARRNDAVKSVRPRSAVLLHHSLPLDNGSVGERSASSAAGQHDCSASSDDEVQSLVGSTLLDSPLPLEFRTSPPEGAHRPTRSLSPPPKFFLADQEATLAPAMLATGEAPPAALSVANGSPRKRHRHARHHHHVQRPCLDFEKMQQMKNRSVSTWRHDGELSLFCW